MCNSIAIASRMPVAFSRTAAGLSCGGGPRRHWCSAYISTMAELYATDQNTQLPSSGTVTYLHERRDHRSVFAVAVLPAASLDEGQLERIAVTPRAVPFPVFLYYAVHREVYPPSADAGRRQQRAPRCARKGRGVRAVRSRKEAPSTH